MVGSLDQWLIILRDHEITDDGPENRQRLARLVALAEGLDPDVERNRLARLLRQPELKKHRQTLNAMASQAKVIDYGPSTILLLARLLEQAEDEMNAITVLRAAVVRYPGDLWTNIELARLLRSAQPPQPDEAIRYYTAARALRPETGFDLAGVLEMQGRHDESEALYREQVRRNPENPMMLLSLLSSLQHNGKVDEARSLAERIVTPYRDRVKRQPSSIAAHQRLGVFLWTTGNSMDAIAAAREAVRLFPKDANPYLSLGKMLLAQDDVAGAVAAYRDAIRIDPANVDSHYILASVLWRSGDRQGEIAALRGAIRIESAPQRPKSQAVVIDESDGDHNFIRGQALQAVGVKEESERAAPTCSRRRSPMRTFMGGWQVVPCAWVFPPQPVNEVTLAWAMLWRNRAIYPGRSRPIPK